MKKCSLILLLIISLASYGQNKVYDTITFYRGGKLYRFITYPDSIKINTLTYKFGSVSKWIYTAPDIAYNEGNASVTNGDFNLSDGHKYIMDHQSDGFSYLRYDVNNEEGYGPSAVQGSESGDFIFHKGDDQSPGVQIRYSSSKDKFAMGVNKIPPFSYALDIVGGMRTDSILSSTINTTGRIQTLDALRSKSKLGYVWADLVPDENAPESAMALVINDHYNLAEYDQNLNEAWLAGGVIHVKKIGSLNDVHIQGTLHIDSVNTQHMGKIANSDSIFAKDPLTGLMALAPYHASDTGACNWYQKNSHVSVRSLYDTVFLPFYNRVPFNATIESVKPNSTKTRAGISMSGAMGIITLQANQKLFDSTTMQINELANWQTWEMNGYTTNAGTGNFGYLFTKNGMYPKYYSTSTGENQFIGLAWSPWNDGYFSNFHVQHNLYVSDTAFSPVFKTPGGICVTGTPWTAMNYLTSYTETDPGVHSWAKASVKPTYSASEVSAIAKADSNKTVSGNYVTKKGMVDYVASTGGSQWITNGTNIYYLGNVGINTTNPAPAKLIITGKKTVPFAVSTDADGSMGDSTAIYVNAKGQVGIGTTNLSISSGNRVTMTGDFISSGTMALNTNTGKYYCGLSSATQLSDGSLSSSQGTFYISNASSNGVIDFRTNQATYTMRLDGSGQLGILNAVPSCPLDVNGSKIRLRTAKTPASATDTGNSGDICWDASYVYVCTATNTWKRSPITTW